MKTLPYLTIIITPLLAQGFKIRPANGTQGGNASIVQGILGFGVPSKSGAPEPCVGTGLPGICYGVPDSLLVVSSQLLVPPGTAGVYYTSIETATFSGTASTTFQLSESGTIVLQLSVNGSAINANTNTIISQPGMIPDGTYTGPATLTTTSTVTPHGGGTPLTLTASTQLFIVPPPGAEIEEHPSATVGALPRIAQGFVGFGIPPTATSPGPCVGNGAGNYCYGVPSGIVVLPLNLIEGPNLGGVYYVSIETTNANGSASTLYQLVQDGRVIMQFSENSEVILVNRIVTFAEDSLIPSTAHTGSATLIATTTLTPRNDGPILIVKGGITLQIIQ